MSFYNRCRETEEKSGIAGGQFIGIEDIFGEAWDDATAKIMELNTDVHIIEIDNISGAWIEREGIDNYEEIEENLSEMFLKVYADELKKQSESLVEFQGDEGKEYITLKEYCERMDELERRYFEEMKEDERRK